MIHLKKSRNNQFYWLSVTKKANTFEVIAKSSESYTSKQNCEKAVKAEAELFDGNCFILCDHTAKKNTAHVFVSTNKGFKKYDALANKGGQAEIEFVQKLKKEI